MKENVIQILIVILVFAVGIFCSYMIATSDLPEWLKFFLLS